MRLIVVAGFLGSGKTSLLLEVARRLVAEGRTVAVIENEIGEVGIDGRLIAEQGLLVRELFGGCICCTLSTGVAESRASPFLRRSSKRHSARGSTSLKRGVCKISAQTRTPLGDSRQRVRRPLGGVIPASR